MFKIENSSIGRIVVPDNLPPATALFYTTTDFNGRLNKDIAAQLMSLVGDRFGVDASLTTCTQVHGATVRAARHEKEWRECDSCDALWSQEKGSALAIKVADCLPVTLIDPESHVIANIHSGWRGAVQQITAATIDMVVNESDFRTSRASAWLGPSIRACCFEVGEEVVDQFLASYEDAGRFILRDKAKPHIDVPNLTAALLRSRGFRAERIFDSGLCTRCEGSIFHSFRRDGTAGGRNLAIVAQ
jgi:polyphenol oxidase